MLIHEDYFENIFNTVREAILVLDENMRVLSANRSFFTIFNVDAAHTVGSLLYDLGNGQWNIPHLRVLLEDILPKNDTVDDYEIDHSFESIGRKTMRLNARKIREKDNDQPIILLAIEDITERKEIEAGLEKTRKDLEETKIAEDEARAFAESVINTVREPLISLDHDLRVVTVSRSFYEFFKVKPEETVGQLIYDLGNKQWDIPELRELLETILPQHTTFDNYEVEHEFATIGRRIMLLNARQIQRAFGEERIILLAFEDITERKQLEQFLTESEFRYRRIFDTASDGIVLLEKSNGHIVHANMAVENMLGYAEDEYVGKKLQDIGVPVDTSDFPSLMQVLNKCGILNYDDVQVQTKSGQYIDTDIYMVDRARLAQCNIRDVSHRKLAEEALRESQKMLEGIINAIPVRVFWKDKNLVYLGCNAAFAQDAGFSDPKEIIGKDDYQMGWHDQAELYRSDDRQVIESGGSKYLTEEPQTTPEGDIITLLTSKIPLLNAYGEIIGVLGTYMDISELKRAEESLKLNSEVLSNLNEGVNLVGVDDGIIKYVNPLFEKMFGYDAGELLGKDISVINAPTTKSPEETKRDIFKILKQTGEWHGDIENIRKDGTRFWCYANISLFDDHRLGQVCISVHSDITEHRQAVIELKESENLYRSLFENMLNGFAYCRMLFEEGEPRDFIYLSVNNVFEQLTGLSDVVGRKITEIIPGIRETDPTLFEVYGRVASTGQSERVDIFVKALQMWFSISVYSPAPEHFVAVFEVITARKQAEQELKESKDLFEAVIENVPLMIFLKEATDLRFVIFNRAGEELLGYDREALLGKNNLDLFPPEQAAHFMAKEREVLDSEAGMLDIPEESIETAKKGQRLLHTRKICIMGNDGATKYLLGISEDITKRKHAEEENVKLEDQLRHAQKMEAVGTLAGGIAHDFNNILTVIIGYGTMIMNKLEDGSPLKRHMNDVLIAADRAANLTNRLLVFSRKQVVEVKPVNVNEIILGLQKMLVRIIRENIDFNLDLADKDLIVPADAGQIEQVLMNLAVNASDAMQASGRLTISTGLEELDEKHVAGYGYGMPGRYALITVTDTGMGMDAETREKIFEPFFTTKGIGEGTGLGLAISYGIIKQHGGYINVYSEPGQGTAFTIYLPLSEKAASPDRRMETDVSVKGGNETVLVAEDDASLRGLFRIVLESFGYSVISAVDGEDATTKFMENRERIDLVLIDMIMPKKNGKEVVNAIRKVSPLIKILYMSGYTMDIIKTEELADSDSVFIHKPLQPRDLLIKVREVLDR